MAVAELFCQDDFVKVRGRINSFNGRYEIILQQLRRAEESEIGLSDFVPKTSWNIEEMWYQLEQFVAKIRNHHLRGLLQVFLMDEEISKLLHVAPAAQSLHHAYIGGLLEHILSLCTLGELITVRYFWVDRDLLVAGAILHDIGKIYELTYSRAFGYSTEGTLIGHIGIGLVMLEQKARGLPQFPHELLVLLEHLDRTQPSCRAWYRQPTHRYTWLVITVAWSTAHPWSRGVQRLSSSIISTRSIRSWERCSPRLKRIPRPLRYGQLEFSRWDTRCWILGNTWGHIRDRTPRANPAPRHTLRLLIIGGKNA